MVFSSTIFLFAFLPLVLVVYHLLPRSLRNTWLLALSLFFYAWGETFFLLLMLVSIALNTGLGLLVDRWRSKPRLARAVVGVAVLVNLSFLGWYKYAGFVVDNLNRLLAWTSFDPIELGIHLPIGISFFTFQALSYVIDVYRQESPVQKNPLHVALYISLFPQLIAGPIVRFRDVADQIRSRVVRIEDFAYGIERFVLGLAKKLLIANTLAMPADALFEMPASELSFSLAWLGIVAYTLQIYFDFSGYSDMAIGLGRMFGFRFSENFRHPYIARSMTEFWRRWHISLSSWFRDYVYIPLGGNRHGAARTYRNLLLVFLITGLWHGASWNFVLWGIYHGTFLLIERLRRVSEMSEGPRTSILSLGHLYVILAAMGGWVLFRCETLSGAAHYYLALIGLGEGTNTLYDLGVFFTRDVKIALLAGVLGSIPWWPWLRERFVGWGASEDLGWVSSLGILAGRLVAVVLLLVLLIFSMVQISGATHNPFIYFRF